PPLDAALTANGAGGEKPTGGGVGGRVTEPENNCPVEYEAACTVPSAISDHARKMLLSPAAVAMSKTPVDSRTPPLTRLRIDRLRSSMTASTLPAGSVGVETTV